jgi:hypothetical protein
MQFIVDAAEARTVPPGKSSSSVWIAQLNVSGLAVGALERNGYA